MTERVEEKFHYAKLENNDQIFEIKADKLKDVFVPVADLRDSRVARFDSKDVTRLELTHGSETLVLVKVKEKDTDRWRMEKPTAGDAESSKISEILDKLSMLSARDKELLDKMTALGNSVEKNRAMRAFGANLVEHGEDFQSAREEAARRAQRDELEFVPSFHPDLVTGVATYALELLQKAPDLEVLYVPIGQGSGICGCILARDLLGLTTEIVGVQSTEAPSYALSYAAGTVVRTNSSNTLADGMATRVPDADALAIIRKGASHIVQVTDDEVAQAVRAYWTDTHNLAEGAGAAALAAALQEKAKLRGKRVGLILTGGNIDFDLFQRWVGTDATAAPGARAVA
jgi:threonine dehydratase